MNAKCRSARRGEVTLRDLAMLNFTVLALIAGFVYGIRIGSGYSIVGQIIWALIGPIVAVSAALAGTYALAVAAEPFDRCWAWWRPYPPPCENGCCRTYRDYTDETVPRELCERWNGLSWSAYRCRCGYLYGGGYERPLLNRWVRVLPDGTLRPYLKHRVCGRWQLDDPQSVIAVSRSAPRAEIQIPQWVLPPLVSILCGGFTMAVVFKDLRTKPEAGMMVISSTAGAFVCGCVMLQAKRRVKPPS